MLSLTIMCSMFFFWFVMVTLMVQFEHLLNMLLSLEAMSLSLLLLLCGVMIYMYEVYFILVIITLSVCEASMGLAVLVALIRVSGNDYVYGFNMSKC
nr:NADH dehydrogenase subunit 4L [Acharax sp. NY-2022]